MLKKALHFLSGLTIGSLSVATLTSGAVWAQLTQVWSKDQVVPIVLVKPSFGSFVPSDGNSMCWFSLKWREGALR